MHELRTVIFHSTLFAGGLLLVWACGGGGKKVNHAASGTGTEVAGDKKNDVGGAQPSTRLSSIQVKPIEPPDAGEGASSVETVIAFENIGALVDCEHHIQGWFPAAGTIVVQFGIDEEGHVAEEPQVVLTTSSEKGEIGKCIEEAIGGMDFSSVSLESPLTVHVILKYTE